MYECIQSDSKQIKISNKIKLKYNICPKLLSYNAL